MRTLKTARSYYEATARQRISALTDSGSFREFCPPSLRRSSPHLSHFNLPASFDDGVVVGEAVLDGVKIALAAQEGRFMGGAIGEIHSAKITGLLRRCLRVKPHAVLFLLDSGGVRLQEANAGEIGVAEIIRALLDVRAAGIPVLGVVGGVCGAFGGAGILSGCCDALIVSEEGRIGVSGPEVIETTMGVETFDSRDKALVWRVYGGRSRHESGLAQVLVNNTLEDFRSALVQQIRMTRDYSLEQLEQKQRELEERFARAANGGAVL